MHLQRLRHSSCHPSSVRLMLLPLAVVLMVIIGLIGMHTLSTGPAAHDASTESHEAAVSLDTSASGHLGSSAPDTQVAHSETCNDSCQPPSAPPLHHAGLMMACNLALLVGFIFLLPLVAMCRSRIRNQLRLLLPSPRPPSLIVLSISRT